MARPAPGVERVMRVLNFLAAHAEERFTLSELARRLELNKATAHALLNALTDAGYLLRHPTDMTYTLGPAVIALGGAAQQQFRAVEFALEEMRILADELGLECIVSAAVEGEIVILARTGVLQPLGRSVQLGQRLPIVPPLGAVFVAWARDEPAGWEPYRTGLAAVRERGYAVNLEVRGVIERILDDLGTEEYLLVDLEEHEAYRVSTMGAPVFGPDGGVEIALFIVGFRAALSARAITDYGERLLQAARAVTKSIHGVEPPPP